jgi:hypothetical protein
MRRVRLDTGAAKDRRSPPSLVRFFMGNYNGSRVMPLPTRFARFLRKSPAQRLQAVRATSRWIVSTCGFPLRLVKNAALRRRLRGDKKTLKRLSPSLLKVEAWERSSDTSLDSEMGSIFRTIPDAHKWHHYFPIYESAFARYRGRPIKFLEIGVYRGGSMALWRRYFHREATIVGIDIDPRCARYADPAAHIHIRIGDQSDPVFLSQVVNEFGPFDVIVDDGSHFTHHIIASFNELFDAGLRAGGTYLVEDLCSNYWPFYRTGKVSFIDVVKTLVDLMHSHYVDNTSERPFLAHHPEQKSQLFVPRITRLIEEIRMCDSVAILLKATNKEMPTSEHV